MTTIETRLFPVEMHRPTFSLGAAILPAHELREHLKQRATPPNEGAVVTVGCDDAVLLRDRRLHADGDRLLPVVEVAEAADQLGLVERISGDLHAPHLRHVLEEGNELLRAGLDGAGGRLAPVGCEGDGGLDGDGTCLGGDGSAEGQRGGEEGSGQVPQGPKGGGVGRAGKSHVWIGGLVTGCSAEAPLRVR